MPEVIFIFRKKSPHFFSIEKVFSLIIKKLKDIQTDTIHLPFYGVSYKNMIFLLRERFKNYRGNIYHITGDAHYIALLLPRGKTVLTIHDCVFINQYKGLKKWILKKIFLDWPVAYVATITTISEKTKQEILHNTKCFPGKIKVIPNPVSESLYHSAQSFNTEKQQILFIGSTPNKNLERVAVALKSIPCFLRIIGKLSNDQRRLLRENNIDFSDISGISEEELNEEYRKSDIVMFPSLYEGFGLPIIEGQKTGRVVITSNLAPMNEVSGGGAHLVDPYSIASIKEGILRIINEEDYRNELIQKGFKNVERFSPQTIADQYLELYQKISSNS